MEGQHPPGCKLPVGLNSCLGKQAPEHTPAARTPRPLRVRVATGPTHSPRCQHPHHWVPPPRVLSPRHLGLICFLPLPHLQLSEEFHHFPSQPLAHAGGSA